MHASGMWYGEGNERNSGSGPEIEAYDSIWDNAYRFNFVANAPYDLGPEKMESIQPQPIKQAEVKKKLVVN
jgi:hypothetical protein